MPANPPIETYFPTQAGVDMKRLMIHSVGRYSVSKPKDAASILETVVMFVKLLKGAGTDTHKLRLLDGTACVGADTISFASAFGKVMLWKKTGPRSTCCKTIWPCMA